MSDQTSTAHLCPHCRATYRPATWGRAYLCPACSRPLSVSTRRPQPGNLGRWAAIVCAVAGIGVGGAAVLERVRVRNAAPPLAAFEEEARRTTALPERFEESLRQRLSLLQADLAHDPQYPLLLGRVVECCLSLSLLKRDSDPDQAQRWLEQARMYQRALRGSGVPAWAELEQRINNADRLRWGASALPPSHFRQPGAAGMPPLSPIPADLPTETFPGGPGSPPSGRPRPIAFPHTDTAPPSISVGPPPVPSFNTGLREGPAQPASPGRPAYPGAGSMGAYPSTGGYPGKGLPGGAYPGGADPRGGYPGGTPTRGPGYPGTGGFPGGASVPPRSPSARSGVNQAFRRPPPVSPAVRTASLRKALRGRPGDLDLTWQLAEALEEQGRDEALSEEARQPYCEEAVALYLQASRTARTRVQRGTFLSAAARVCEDAHQDQRGYDLLKQALREIPYSSLLWQRMRDVSLRLGKLEESERATANAQRWSLPEASL